MASLTGSSIASTYKDLLQVSNSNSGIDGTARVVSDGEDTASKLFLDTNRVGVGIAPTDGTLHVHTASAGSVTPDGDADDLVVENSASGGISILTPDANPGRIAFGSPSDEYGAVIMHQQSTGKLSINTEGGTGNISMATGSGVTALTINSSQNVHIGGSNPTKKLEVAGDIKLLNGTNNITVFYGGDNWGQRVIYSTGNMDFFTNGANRLSITGAGSVGIGTDSAAELLEVEKDQNAHTVIQVDNNTAGTGASGGFKASADGADLYMRTFSSSFTTSGRNIQDSVQLLSVGASGGFVIASNHATADMSFWTNDTQRLTIDGATGSAEFSGDVLVAEYIKHEGDTDTNIRFQTDHIDFTTANTLALRVDNSQNSTFSGNILPGADDAQDLGSGSLRFDDIHATNGTIQTSDQRLKDNIVDSSLGLDFVNALRPVKYQWKDYTYDVEKEVAVEAKEAEYETVVVQEAIEAKEAVMGTRQKTVSKEVEKTKTEIVEEDGKYVQKEVSYTETVEEHQYEEVNLYDEDGEVIGLHKIPIMEEYEVEPAVEAVEEITEEKLVSEAVEAKDAVMETKEKTFTRTHFGLIAQEVEQVLKDSSLTNNDFAGLIYDEDADRYGMRYHELISPLIKAVQELSKKVTDLENK